MAIRQERRRRGLEQKALADKVGVSRQWIIATEQGKAGASLGLVLRTLNVLGLRLSAHPATPTAPDAAFPETRVNIDEVVETARRGRR
ncbi:MAG: helix-turn-helix domain-containing protein [Myxococcota bacterium]